MVKKEQITSLILRYIEKRSGIRLTLYTCGPGYSMKGS